MTILTQAQVRKRLRTAGLSLRQAKIGSAVACVESSTLTVPPKADFGRIGDQALADDIWGFSYGGFQIRSKRDQKGTGGIRDEDRLLEVGFNIDSAVAIFRSDGWEAWSTYRSGEYKAFLQDEFPPPVGTYVVMPGDSLSKIAAMTHTGPDGQPLPPFTWQELARVNGLHEPWLIRIGLALLLPGAT